MVDGRDLISTLAMGANAMMLGARMVVAEEIWAHRDYKEYVTKLDESASRVVMSTFGKQHRVLNNATAQDVVQLETEGITDFEAYHSLVQGSLVQQAYRSGDYSQGLIDMGPAGVFAREVKDRKSTRLNSSH